MKKTRKGNLTENQEKFCHYYLDTDGNASEAYRMAYHSTNMMPSTIYHAAWELINNPKITQRIDEIRSERREATEQQRKDAESRLMDIINADPADLFYEDPITGKPIMRKPWQLSKKMRHAVKSVKWQGDSISYELHGKIEAARLLGSWNGWDAPQHLDVRQGNLMIGELRIGFDDDE